MIVRSWDEVIAALRSRPDNIAAQAAADLLPLVRERWEGKVLPDLWMHDLRFVAPGDTGTRVDEVRVGWEGQAHVVTLRDGRGVIVAADHVKPENAGPVLDAFLHQLAGEP